MWKYARSARWPPCTTSRPDNSRVRRSNPRSHPWWRRAAMYCLQRRYMVHKIEYGNWENAKSSYLPGWRVKRGCVSSIAKEAFKYGYKPSKESVQ